MQCDMRKKSASSSKSRCGQSGECGYWVLRSRKAGEDKIEPHYVRLDLPDGVHETHGGGEAAESPATNHVEARQLCLFVTIQRVTILVCSEIIVSELIGQNG